MRARFDANKDVPDPRKAQLLLADGCRQLWEMRNPKPFRCMFNYQNINSYCLFF